MCLFLSNVLDFKYLLKLLVKTEKGYTNFEKQEFHGLRQKCITSEFKIAIGKINKQNQ